MTFKNRITKSINFLGLLFLASMIFLHTSCKEMMDPITEEEMEEENGNEEKEYDGQLINSISLNEVAANGRDLAKMGNIWVLVGSQIFVSNDGLLWELINHPFSNSYNKVIHNGSKFIAIGNNDIIISEDGRSWSQTYQTNNWLKNITWTGQEILICTDNGEVLKSLDGITWQVIDANTPLHTILVFQNKLVGLHVGRSSTTISNDGGQTWSDYNTIGGNINNLIEVNGVLYGEENKKAYRSTDGVSWSSSDMNNDGYWIDYVTYHEGQYYGVFQGASPGSPVLNLGGIAVSDDGNQWVKINSGAHSALDKIIVTDDKELWAVGATLLNSTTGQNWINRYPRLMDHTKGVRWAIDRAILVGDEQGFLVTKNGIEYEVLGYTDVLSGYGGVTWTGSEYYMVGKNGSISKTTDGTQVIALSSPTTQNLNDIVYSEKGLVAVGRSGTIAYSSDGTTWENYTLSDDPHLIKVEYFDGIFYIASDDGLYTSSDGQSWTYVEVDANSNRSINLIDIASNGKELVVITEDEVYQSFDGIQWTKVLEHGNATSEYTAIEYTGEEFMLQLSPFNGRISFFASFKGTKWTEVFQSTESISGERFAITDCGFVRTSPAFHKISSRGESHEGVIE